MYLLLRKALFLPVDICMPLRASADISKSWLKLALLSLLLSGFFSVIIVFARTPGIDSLITDPLFARKSLVLHVDLALIVWFYSFLAVLYRYLNPSKTGLFKYAGLQISFAGVLLMILPLLIRGVEPILANYVPVLDHPLFMAGLALFAFGLIINFSPAIDFRKNDKAVVSDSQKIIFLNARQSIRCAGLVVIAAIVVFIMSWISTPALEYRPMVFELRMWGGGHILQFANVLGMITVWLILLKKLTGRELFTNKTNRFLLLILTVPALLSPILLLQGTHSQLYYNGFTQLMRWFIFPVVLIYMGAGILKIIQSRKDGSWSGPIFTNMYFNGFMVSVLLTFTGFVLGMMIRSSTTLIPAHYHASLGGVTAAYMVMVFILLKSFGYNMISPRASFIKSMQPFLFGIGQTVFVIGFAYAGLHGMGRKMFGDDQLIHSTEAMIGLVVMSLGGLMAITGGILFVYIIIKSIHSNLKT